MRLIFKLLETLRFLAFFELKSLQMSTLNQQTNMVLPKRSFGTLLNALCPRRVESLREARAPEGHVADTVTWTHPPRAMTNRKLTW